MKKTKPPPKKAAPIPMYNLTAHGGLPEHTTTRSEIEMATVLG